MKNIIQILILILLITAINIVGQTSIKDKNEKSRQQISTLLDEFNVAAANADFDKYFAFYAEDAIFIGTDATENWDKKSFMVWAKPFFDKKRTWNFKSIQRNIFLIKREMLRGLMSCSIPK